MGEARAPRGNEWAAAVDALGSLARALTVRSHYAEGHPAILRADEAAAGVLARLLEDLPELVFAVIDGEVVVCERPMPELRERLAAVTEAMLRHDVECIVFQRGITRPECTLLSKTLAARADEAAPARNVQAELAHILLRYAELRLQDDERAREADARWFSADAAALFQSILRSAASDEPIAIEPVRELAERIVDACISRTFVVEQRCLAPGDEDGARHAANVATMAAAMALEANHPRETCTGVAAAGLLHDIGHLLLPAGVRGVPEPLLDDAARSVFRGHCFAGARFLLASGCPSLWVATALEHHRGVDGKGYPALSTREGPHELVRLVSLANFVDCKRTRLTGRDDAYEVDAALRRASELAGRYFAASDLRLFQRALGVFPPGTTVELSDRQVAVVTQANPTEPHRPRVELLTGLNARKHADLKTLDAAEDRYLLSIVRAVAPPLAVGPADWAALAPSIQREAPPAPSLTPEPIPSSSAPPPHVARLSGFYSSRGPSTVERVTPAPESRRSSPVTTSSAPPRALVADDSAYRAELERTYLERIGSLEKIPVLKVGMGQLSKLTLDHQAGFILSMIDGMTPIETLIDVSGIGRVEVLKIVDELVRSGAIVLE
jgi:HD-GYP domain-containing protein (c-di-GMP phosphodiesterase class II)